MFTLQTMNDNNIYDKAIYDKAIYDKALYDKVIYDKNKSNEVASPNKIFHKSIISYLSIDILIMILEYACNSHYDIYNISLTCKTFYSILSSKQFYPNKNLISICNNINIIDNFPNFTFMTDFSYCDCLFKLTDIKHDFIRLMYEYDLFPISNTYRFRYKLKQVLDKLEFIKGNYKNLYDEMQNKDKCKNDKCLLEDCYSNSMIIQNKLIDMRNVDLYNRFIININNLYNCFVIGLKKMLNIYD